MAQNDLTVGRVPVTLYKLTAPMIMGVSSSIVVQALEIGFIGQLGTRYVAAITFTFPLTMILSSIALGIGIGTSSIIARSVGGGDQNDARQLGTHSLILVAFTIAILSFIGWLTIDPVFLALGAPPDMLPLIHSYLDIFYPSTVLLTSTMTAGSIMRASGQANIPGVVMTLGALFNLALDPILIFGWFGFPRLELAGAAIAVMITRLATTAVLFYYILDSGLLKIHAPFAQFWASAKRIMVIGLPAVATQLIGPVSGTIITRLLAGHGEIVVAGFGVATRIEAVSIMILFALSGSIGPFVGQNWGAGQRERVRQGVRVAYQVSLGWGLFAALIMVLYGDTIAAWADDEPSVVLIAALYLTIVPWSYGMWGVLMMSSASFNALGKPLPSTALSFTRMFIIYIPMAMSFNHLYGYQGIFIATTVTNIVMGLAGYWWFRARFFPFTTHTGEPR
ncbi:MAG: MATE family efflux transporter [Pseudomonadales bacterium]|jgi:putative MATE family efflux protein|nr:MATE family efflux transporter [Pseudomonadales bacterium]MDP6470155.1 MATE family efflux transporter [Pseudomonadales bacterium]MDP6827061.1 MATE family efflux transporter [Pseudomonadales bacterium]